MRDDRYRRAGLPTAGTGIESAEKEMNDRIQRTEMFWNNREVAEVILQIRSASLCDDDGLVRLLANRAGQPAFAAPDSPVNQAENDNS